MRILFHLGHPAHVHYFKNTIKLLKNNGHKILVSAIDKEVTITLLKRFNIEYILLGRNLNGLFGKICSVIRNDLYLLKISLSFKPDLFVSTNLPFPAHVGFIIRKPVIGFTDTEHASINHTITNPFTDVIFTPSCFQKEFGKKHIRFNGYMELCYLHPNYFIPDPSVLDMLGVKKDEKYVILRFVSWNASHDVGHTGLSLEMKLKAVNELSKYAKVFISSESDLPKDLKKYQIKIPPERMHDVLYYSSLFFGESGTMATESALLGVPTVRVSTLAKYLGNFRELKNKYNLLYYYDEGDRGLLQAIELIKDPNSKRKWKEKLKKLLKDKIDVTKMMVWFVNNYPESVAIIKEDHIGKKIFISKTDYKDKFK